jgi:hypothetical protein
MGLDGYPWAHAFGTTTEKRAATINSGAIFIYPSAKKEWLVIQGMPDSRVKKPSFIAYLTPTD